jgi:hypothetical protein
MCICAYPSAILTSAVSWLRPINGAAKKVTSFKPAVSPNEPARSASQLVVCLANAASQEETAASAIYSRRFDQSMIMSSGTGVCWNAVGVPPAMDLA